MTDNDLNEQVEVTVDDATVITVPIDATLSNSNEAADAKAVGDALALKADKSELQAAVKVNNQPADAQGLILIDGSDIPVSDEDTDTLAEAVTNLKGKTAEDIPMSSDAGAKMIAEVVNANSEAIENMEEMTGATMPMEPGSQTMVKAAIEARAKTVNRQAPDIDGNIDLSVVPLAENLQSDKMQSVDGSFIIRTTGGSSSVSDGKAYPQHILGTVEHDGYVAEVLNMTVIPVTRTEPDEPITATIDRDTFVAAVTESGTTNLYYTTEWSEDPEDYGVTVSGTPVAGDHIKIEYTKEARGTIKVADPDRLIGTGWNLFNYNQGYARVVKYSTEYGYKIGGTYTSLAFSATLTGERSSITPGADGIFNVASDGYVFVTGGNNTDTYILATWSDWMDGPASGYWEPYKENGVDLSYIMSTYFPYGLLAVGTTRDEIDLAAKRAISRIERKEYSEENRAAAAATGRGYSFDENNVYIVRESPVLNAITIEGEYTVSEHGLEWFTETVMPLITEILYGKNLRDKLERDVLTISPQNLAAEEQAQVRRNIGVMDPPLNGNGTAAQLLKTNGDGTTEWTTQGTPTDDQVGTAVSAWLTAHPEATTTVQDGAISRAKLNDDLKAKTDAVPDLKSAITKQTRNLITGILHQCSIESNSSIASDRSSFDLFFAPVVIGKTYYVSTNDDAGLVCAFYNSQPAVGSVAYNSTRTVQASKTITAPITGYIAFRTAVGYQYAQIEEGTSATEYIRPLTAIDAEAREDVKELQEETNCIDNVLEEAQKTVTESYRIEEAYIDANGTIYQNSLRDVFVSYVGGASSVTISNGELYSFYKDKPQMGSDGTTRVQISGTTKVTVPDGYNYIAVGSYAVNVPVFITEGNVQGDLSKIERMIDKKNLVEGHISQAGIDAAGKIYTPLESRDVYYAPVYGLGKIYITKGDLIAFYKFIPTVDTDPIASRQSISDGEIVSVPSGAYYIAIRTASETQVYRYHTEWIVDESGNGDFTTVTDAVARAVSGDSIFIRSGNYTGETIEAWGKELHIVGEDKQTVIISNDLDDYDTPPIEMDIGSLENVTVIAVKKEGTAKGAYAMHIEDASEYGKTFTVRNCVFKAASGASVGMGMRGNYSVIFENCDFIATDYVASGTSGYAFYFHDTVDSNLVGADKVAFRNCRFYGKHSAGVVIRIDSNGLAGNTVEVEFVCNAIANPENDGSSNYLSLHNNGGTNEDWKHLKGFSNSILSFGNQQDTVDYGYTG